MLCSRGLPVGRYSGALVIISILFAASALAGPITDIATGQPVLYPSYVTGYNGQLYFRGGLAGDGSDHDLAHSRPALPGPPAARQTFCGHHRATIFGQWSRSSDDQHDPHS